MLEGFRWDYFGVPAGILGVASAIVTYRWGRGPSLRQRIDARKKRFLDARAANRDKRTARQQEAAANREALKAKRQQQAAANREALEAKRQQEAARKAQAATLKQEEAARKEAEVARRKEAAAKEAAAKEAAREAAAPKGSSIRPVSRSVARRVEKARSRLAKLEVPGQPFPEQAWIDELLARAELGFPAPLDAAERQLGIVEGERRRRKTTSAPTAAPPPPPPAAMGAPLQAAPSGSDVLPPDATLVPTPRRRPPTSSTAPRYVIERPLGSGAQGTVHLAKDTLMGRAVVVKKLPGARSGAAQELLVREAQAASRVQHANLVTVYDVTQVEGEPALVMEYVDGGNLQERLQRSNYSASKAIALLRGILAGLAALHRASVLHRDVKPANVLLTQDGTPKLTDFGVARTDDTLHLSMTGFQPGTLLYMSPEQVMGDRIDARSDLYSAAALLHEVLTGRHYLGDVEPRDYHIRQAIAEGRVAISPDLPNEMRAFLQKGLARAPAERFGDAEEMMKALDALQIARRTATARDRWATLARDHPGLRAATGVAALLDAAKAGATEAEEQAHRVIDELVAGLARRAKLLDEKATLEEGVTKLSRRLAEGEISERGFDAARLQFDMAMGKVEEELRALEQDIFKPGSRA